MNYVYQIWYKSFQQFSKTTFKKYFSILKHMRVGKDFHLKKKQTFKASNRRCYMPFLFLDSGEEDVKVFWEWQQTRTISTNICFFVPTTLNMKYVFKLPSWNGVNYFFSNACCVKQNSLFIIKKFVSVLNLPLILETSLTPFLFLGYATWVHAIQWLHIWWSKRCYDIFILKCFRWNTARNAKRNKNGHKHLNMNLDLDNQGRSRTPSILGSLRL